MTRQDECGPDPFGWLLDRLPEAAFTAWLAAYLLLLVIGKI